MSHPTQSVSVWMNESAPDFEELTTDATCDVCIVGAGIAGLSVAYHLLKEGRSVIVLDDGVVGGGVTQRTTAHLSNAIDKRYTMIEKWHGQEGSRLAAASHSAAIDRMEKASAHNHAVREHIPSGNCSVKHIRYSLSPDCFRY